MDDIDVTDPNYWRGRAREMRELSAITPDIKTRNVFLRIATHYDDLAVVTERLTYSVPLVATRAREPVH